MREKDVELSVGKCVIREVRAREMNEQRILMAQVSEDIERKFGRHSDGKDRLRLFKAKSKELNDLYLDFVAALVVRHEFRDFQGPMAEYIGNMSQDDLSKLEAAVNELSSLSPEVRRDLPERSQEEKSPSSRRTESSSSTCDSSGITASTSKTWNG